MQDWSVEHVFQKFVEIGVTKLAMLLSADMISQLSLEQFTEEGEQTGFVTNYFDNQEQGQKWLLS